MAIIGTKMIRFSKFSISSFNHQNKYDFVDRHFRRPAGTSYQSLSTGISTDRFKKDLHHFIWSLDTKHLVEKCTSFGIPKEIYSKAIKEFRELLQNDAIPYLRHEDIRAHIDAASPIEKLVLPGFLRFIRNNFPESVKKLKLLSSKIDLENPSNLFPETRLMKREIIMHVGPTNS